MLDENFLKKLSNLHGLKLLKLHPHIKNVKQVNLYGFTQVLSSIPAEILITQVAYEFKNVKVYHHGSTVFRYIAFKNVGFINIESEV